MNLFQIGMKQQQTKKTSVKSKFGLEFDHIQLANCMATPEGELFLSCSVCDRKYWAARVGKDEEAVLRLGNFCIRFI